MLVWKKEKYVSKTLLVRSQLCTRACVWLNQGPTSGVKVRFRAFKLRQTPLWKFLTPSLIVLCLRLQQLLSCMLLVKLQVYWLMRRSVCASLTSNYVWYSWKWKFSSDSHAWEEEHYGCLKSSNQVMHRYSCRPLSPPGECMPVAKLEYRRLEGEWDLTQ